VNATAEIPNPKFEKFSFRLPRAATSSGNPADWAQHAALNENRRDR
jgi:hypothetical protein